jgi:hypothetical protein
MIEAQRLAVKDSLKNGDGGGWDVVMVYLNARFVVVSCSCEEPKTESG